MWNFEKTCFRIKFPVKKCLKLNKFPAYLTTREKFRREVLRRVCHFPNGVDLVLGAKNLQFQANTTSSVVKK